MSGGGAFGLGGNKSNDQSSFNQDVWGTQGDALKNLYSQVGNLFDSTSGWMKNRMGSASDYMDNIAQGAQPAWKQQMQGGAFANPDLMNQLMRSITASNNQPSATSEINAMVMGGEGNNYADAMKQSYMEDANKAQEMMLANTDARAAASGMSGGSRHGIMQAQGMDDINTNLQQNLARTGYGSFDRDLDRKLQIAGQADQGTLARQQMMQQMLGSQQQAMSEGLAGSQGMQNLGMGQFSPYMAPWQVAGAYSNAIGAPTVLGSGSSNASSKGGDASGSMGGKG